MKMKEKTWLQIMQKSIQQTGFQDVPLVKNFRIFHNAVMKHRS